MLALLTYLCNSQDIFDVFDDVLCTRNSENQWNNTDLKVERLRRRME